MTDAEFRELAEELCIALAFKMGHEYPAICESALRRLWNRAVEECGMGFENAWERNACRAKKVKELP